MIVNIDNLVNGTIGLFNQNAKYINTLVNLYQTGRELTIVKGRRPVVPNYLLPALFIEPESSDFKWQYTRTQRDDLQLTLELVVWNGNEELAVEFLGLLTTLIGRILVYPPYIQRRIPKTAFYLVDSAARNLRFTTEREAQIRSASFSWTGWVIERYDNAVFQTGPATDCGPSQVIRSNPDMTSAGV